MGPVAFGSAETGLYAVPREGASLQMVAVLEALWRSRRHRL